MHKHEIRTLHTCLYLHDGVGEFPAFFAASMLQVYSQKTSKKTHRWIANSPSNTLQVTIAIGSVCISWELTLLCSFWAYYIYIYI